MVRHVGPRVRPVEHKFIYLFIVYTVKPLTIEIVTNEMCAGPLDIMQCELMGKLSLEYTREKIMELRLKSNCLGVQTSSELATRDEKCAILEDLPQQSVKLATKIFSKTPEKQLAQDFGAAVSKALFSLMNEAFLDLGCNELR
ncbi:hypothetical protein Y032_0163g3480 [Ancylostoma ceylanicum]|uniref:Uncharacterized protein n=1 Tax=Ancylostoma ceylanicum TaxID=53326 RepID=A0A016SXU0_9BILA|nr:hypothetical protein Y032_0163g3480 [Ancylostoma ceylanicum]